MNRPEQRIYCWIRQQRYNLAVHKFIYYRLNRSILEDLQFDYIEKRLGIVEMRHKHIAELVTEDGYLSPHDYVDALDHPKIESRAHRLVHRWEEDGYPVWNHIPIMTNKIKGYQLYKAALKEIVAYPI